MSNLFQIKNFTNGFSVIRAGTIIVTKIEDQLMFLMGVDTKTLDICDFGGGVRKKSNETIVGGAFRELREELCGQFGHVDNYANQYMIAEEKSVLILLFTRMTKEQAILHHIEFSERVNHEIDPEIISMAWFNTKDFLKLIFKSKKMYKQTRDFLKRNSEELFTYIRLLDPACDRYIKKYEQYKACVV